MASSGVLYGIIGALGVAVIGGGLYIAKQEGASDKTAAVTAPVAPAPAPTPAPAPAASAPKPPVVAAPPPAPPPPDSGTSQAEAILAQQLVADARRAITRGDFDSAGYALDQAERLAPTSPDVIAARRDWRDARQHANREDRRIDDLVKQAHAAIGRRDYVEADRLLDQAEKIDPRDNAVKQARTELANARQHVGRDDRRIDDLVKQARAAIARHDYAAADKLLDQAETIDRRDRDVQQARAELTAAQRPQGPGPGPGRR
jgi:tetratricopeptide (TPR) repeat protein